MNEPVYQRPPSLREALAALAQWGAQARLLAGGTDLLIAMRRGLCRPEVVIDIGLLDELRGIRRDGEQVTIGALVTHSQIRYSADLAAWAPLLVQACREVGSAQIRNLGTLGGNLGNASPAADSLPALYALEAQVRLMSLSGARWISIAEFFTGPGKTARRPDELIAAVRFRALEPQHHSFFLKLGQRRALRVAKVSAAGIVAMTDDQVQACRLALGAVAPTVIRLPKAEALLAGHKLTSESVAAAAKMASELCTPIDDIRSTVAYRRHMAEVLIQRGLSTVLQEVNV